MTALKSNTKMKTELAFRSLADELQIRRSRIEGDPERFNGVHKLLERVEASVMARNLPASRDGMIELKTRMDERDEAFSIAAQQAEQARLSEARGAPTHKAETGVATRDGWLWLVNKGRYSLGRVEAGRRFREKFSKATDSVASCLNSSGGSGGGGDSAMAACAHAKFEIDGVRKFMISSAGLISGEHLFDLISAVVGRGVTVRQLAGGDGHKAEGVTIELGFALDMAGVYLGAVRN